MTLLFAFFIGLFAELPGWLQGAGRGRLRGQAGLDDFPECKHIAFKPGTIKREGARVRLLESLQGPVSQRLRIHR